jgi:hypothetical protein
MLAKRVGMMYSTTMTNEQPPLIKDGRQVISDGGKSETGIKDYNDCTIRALALSAGIKYDVAHKIGRDAGRKDKKGIISDYLIDEAKKNGLKFFKRVRSQITISKFIKRNPKGKFYCKSRGHAFAIIDGVIFDTDNNTEYQRIKCAWEFIPSAKDSSCQTALDNVS